MRTVAIFLALGLSLSGCDLVKKIQNRRLVVATLIQSPQVAYETIAIDPITEAFLYFGERQGDVTSSEPPVGLEGATVTLSWTDASATPQVEGFNDEGDGNYQIGSQPDYIANTKYTFQAVLGGDTYSAAVVAAPAGTIVEFDAGPVLPAAPSAITRSPDSIDGTLAFYAVYEISGGSLGTPTCSNRPTTPAQFLNMIVDPSEWQEPVFTLNQATCFPNSPGTYAVTLTTMKQGSEFSSNLFVGSAVLAGTSSAGVVVLGM